MHTPRRNVAMRNSLLLMATLAAQPSLAQAPRALTAQDYARAEQFMGYHTTPLVLGAPVRPSWLPGDRFWYHNTIPQGAESRRCTERDSARRRRAPERYCFAGRQTRRV